MESDISLINFTSQPPCYAPFLAKFNAHDAEEQQHTMVPSYVLKYGWFCLSHRYLTCRLTRLSPATAPLVWLHSEDPFRPSDLLEHVRHTTPEVNFEPVPDLPELNLENLAVLNDADGHVALTTHGDDVFAAAPWLLGQEPDASGNIENVTACVVVLVEKSPDVLDAFYWYFYSFDRGPNITQVTEPLNGIFGDDPPEYSFGDHVGDWYVLWARSDHTSLSLLTHIEKGA